ncbi:hypothetical protein M5K25_016750 [Dendrobium thyrsiflorum]|uniref:Mechanosensitive ion channel protein n=1 Tax=Dendrobium thyrsiflorum TaxID=117978 RepID=A0ABD0UKJ8_DENTH
MNSLHKSHCFNKNLSSSNSSEGNREDERPILYGNPHEDSSAEMALDMDHEMEEPKKRPVEDVGQSKELHVVFQDHTNEAPTPLSQVESQEDDSDTYDERRELLQGSATASPAVRDAGAEVLQCSSNSFFRRRRNMLLMAKTRSRLMDPPTTSGGGADERKSMRMPNRSSRHPLRSSQFPLHSSSPNFGLLSKSSMIEDDEEDPFEDLPDEFNHKKMSKWATLQLIGFILLIAALICSLTIHRIQHHTIWGFHLWKLVVLVLVLTSGSLLSDWLTHIIILFLEHNFKLLKRLHYFVYGVRNAIQNCIWLGLLLIAWQSLFDKKVQRENKIVSYIKRILFCLIVTTVLRLVKTLMLKALAFFFHVSTYFDRIQEAVFNQYVVQTLSGPPLIEIQYALEEDDRMIAKVQKFQNAGATIPNDLRAATIPSITKRMISSSDGIYSGSTGLRSSQIGKTIKLSSALLRTYFGRQQSQQEDDITIGQLHKLNQKNISAWNMKRLMRIVRHGTLTLDEQIKRESGEDESTLQVMSEHEAKIAARKIFNNVAKQGAKHVYLVDVMRFMREDEALRTMTLFNGAWDDNRVSRRALKNWVVNAFRDRKALSLTLNDTKTAVNKLHQMANIIVFIILIALWLLILNITTTNFLVFLSSQILLLVFIFGYTLKITFEAIIFLFVTHPFDVGDRCEVDGVEMIVEEMNILTTVFLRYDNLKITYPNSMLAKLLISNYYRSPDMEDSVDFCIHVSTPLEKIETMRERITTFMENKKDHWYPGAQMVIKDFEEINKLHVSLWMRHRINLQDMDLRWRRREPVVLEIIRILRELDIEYRMLPISDRFPSTWST